ncbi:MAG TPA: hypothetical protein VKA46_17860 [Gemmataceae bacterium]|nr:hypothetical protein [Gemmataceae bacterium]
MRNFIPLALALAVTATPAHADDAAEARGIIDKAVQAVGGEAKLATARAHTQKVVGTFFGPAGAIAFTGEWAVNLPDQLRQTTESESDGMKFRTVKVIAGDKGWLRVNDTLEELDKDTLATEHEQTYAVHVATLLPLKDKEFVLAPLGESKVGERPAVGVKVTREDRPTVALFFDKEKGWLLKAEFRVKVHNTPVRQEVFYDDYEDADGLKRPKKTTIKRDGKVLVESAVTEFKPLDKIDAKLFERP